jgi:chaperonin GroEL
MEEPLRQIAANCGDPADVVVAKVAEGTGNFGYNAATSEYADLVETGVIDPTKVTKTALINAASVAGLLLTTDCAINEIEKEENEMPNPGMGMGM